ncbi:hypothetical protein SEVIR_8G203832v4 [Setaria viridis]|uniref:Disease resistance R13L4/SHOC-2-like LRR domain-containing protein n=1 Tax=Setaria viridis TaxID=4556 RepID=A0A4U6THI3_SETVI|nr:hypothetical protein SEVIR_8G203832v2 [Setaria viridis]
MCLYIDRSTRVPNGIGNLTCLEQLSLLGIYDSTINITEELGQLTELRQLSIELDEWNDKLLKCLCKLQKMQELHIRVDPGQCSIGGFDAWVAPRHLRVLRTIHSCWFSTLPAWVNLLLLLDLIGLSIAVRELHQVDLEILGRLPALRSLYLEVDNKNLGILGGFVVVGGAFPCLVRCYFEQFVWPVVFQHGAMPRLGELWFLFYLRDVGPGNLPSLRFVRAALLCDGTSKEEVEQARLR